MGYLIDQSMSVRAAEAYDNGLKPLSKITAADLKAAGITETLAFVRWLAANGKIHADEWHHTSKHFNETNFWSADSIAEQLSELDDVEVLRAEFAQSRQSAAVCVEWVEVRFSEWEGSRNYGRFVEYTKVGIAKGDWFFYEAGKKSLKGNRIEVTRRFSRKPRVVGAEVSRIIRKRAGI